MNTTTIIVIILTVISMVLNLLIMIPWDEYKNR
jgi:hypothetical protein